MRRTEIGGGTHGPHQQGQRGAHERGRHDQHREGQHEPHGGDDGERLGQQRVQDQVTPFEQLHRDRHQQRREPDAQFGQGEGHQRPAQPAGKTPGRVAAECQPGHESRQHGAGRIDRHAEHQRERAQPDHLVDQRGESGTEEQGAQHRREPAPGGWRSRRRRRRFAHGLPNHITIGTVDPRQHPSDDAGVTRVRTTRVAPFRAVLARIPGKGGWTYVKVPKRLAPPITRAWGRTRSAPARRRGVEHQRVAQQGRLRLPARAQAGARHKEEGARVRVAFEFHDD